MTRAEIEEMLRDLAETNKYMQETTRRMREVLEQIQRSVMRTQADAVLRDAKHLHAATRLDVMATTGGKASVETTAPTRRRRPRPKTKKTRKETRRR